MSVVLVEDNGDLSIKYTCLAGESELDNISVMEKSLPALILEALRVIGGLYFAEILGLWYYHIFRGYTFSG